MKQRLACPSIEREKDIRATRYETLVGIWESFPQYNDPLFKLSEPQVVDVIEHYIEDWKALICRYRIDDKIQFSKIAGLMAASIMRYRPIIFKGAELENDCDIYVNENLAILNGLSICSQSSNEPVTRFMQCKLFPKWQEDFRFMLRRRNYTPESLILIFETISIQMLPAGVPIPYKFRRSATRSKGLF